MTISVQSKVLVVLSGGQDSTTCLFHAIEAAGVDNVYAITFDYGQRHDAEIAAAAQIAKIAGLIRPEDRVEHSPGHTALKHGRWELVQVPEILRSVSPLTEPCAELEQYRDHAQMEQVIGKRVEKTFVPMRNTLFLTIAANRAIEIGASTIVTGICGEDNANYPDCTDAFRSSLENTFRESLGFNRDDSTSSLYIFAPLMRLSKAETVRLAWKLPGCVKALAYSHTSYDGKYPPTDKNHANVLRAHGFEEAGLPDPLVVRAWYEGKMPLPTSPNYERAKVEDTLLKIELNGAGQA